MDRRPEDQIDSTNTDVASEKSAPNDIESMSTMYEENGEEMNKDAAAENTSGGGLLSTMEELIKQASVIPTSLASSFVFDGGSGHFDWRRGKYTNKAKRFHPQHYKHILLGLLSLATLFFVYLILVLSSSIPKLHECGIHRITNPNQSREPWAFIASVITVIAGATFVHSAVALFVLSVAPITHLLYQRFSDNQEVDRGLRNFIDRMFATKYFIHAFAASLTIYLMVFNHFPYVDPSAVPAATGTGGTPATLPNELQMVSVHKSISSAATIAMVVFLILLVQKVIIQWIASTYHRQSYKTRIQNTKIVQDTMRKLRRAILEKHSKVISRQQENGTIIAQGCLKPGEKTFGIAEMTEYIPEDEAKAFGELINLSGTNQWTESDMLEALEYWAEEEAVVREGVTSNAQIINKLDNFLLIISVPIMGFISLPLVATGAGSFPKSFTMVTSAILFFTNKTIINLFESILFVIFTHPFDNGDHVQLNGSDYFVQEIGLWSSSFVGDGGCLTVISNIQLKDMAVVNFRRSLSQIDSMTLTVLSDTSDEAIAKLKTRMADFVKENCRDYAPETKLVNVTMVDASTMKIAIDVYHRSNFQDGSLKAARRTKFNMFLRDLMKELNIQLRPAIAVSKR